MVSIDIVCHSIEFKKRANTIKNEEKVLPPVFKIPLLILDGSNPAFLTIPYNNKIFLISLDFKTKLIVLAESFPECKGIIFGLRSSNQLTLSFLDTGLEVKLEQSNKIRMIICIF